jgi:hypothetical protein
MFTPAAGQYCFPTNLNILLGLVPLSPHRARLDTVSSPSTAATPPLARPRWRLQWDQRLDSGDSTGAPHRRSDGHVHCRLPAPDQERQERAGEDLRARWHRGHRCCRRLVISDDSSTSERHGIEPLCSVSILDSIYRWLLFPFFLR